MTRFLLMRVTSVLVLLGQLITSGTMPTLAGPIWCPKGKFFNITNFRCQKCKVSCQYGEVMARYCSRFSDAVCIGITNMTDADVDLLVKDFRGFWSELNGQLKMITMRTHRETDRQENISPGQTAGGNRTGVAAADVLMYTFVALTFIALSFLIACAGPWRLSCKKELICSTMRENQAPVPLHALRLTYPCDIDAELRYAPDPTCMDAQTKNS